MSSAPVLAGIYRLSTTRSATSLGMLFPGDSADLTEQVARIGLPTASFSSSMSRASFDDSCSSFVAASGKSSKRCNSSQKTAELISKTKLAHRKQQILDTYLDSKVTPSQTPEANATRLRQKVEQLSAQLASEADSQHVLQRGQHYLQHMPSICHQKLKRSSFVAGSTSARVAYEAERAYKADQGLVIVMNRMQAALHIHQGPQARRGAAQSACTDVIAELAFPQPPEWQAQLNSFIHESSSHACLRAPGYCCKRTARKLSSSHLLPDAARSTADAYFFSKIVTHWNVGANQGHIKDKLQALLPLVSDTDVQMQIEAAADACVRNMDRIRSNKKAKECHRRQMRRHLLDAA